MAERTELIGAKEANAALRQLPDYARAEAQKAMDVTAFQVQRGAEARVRRRTGFLALRIKWLSRPRSVSAVVGVESDAFYWKFLEYGTVKMGAQPFMRPAALAVEGDHQARLEKALTNADALMARAAGSRLL